ncbi:MAG: hypothetical protein AAGF26_01090 [Cyanobacteria bacterium P01_G01_bin.49]
MKSLLYVIKILLEINGAIALLSLLTFVILRQQKSHLVTTMPQPNQSSQGFHRNIQELPSDLQKQIEANHQQIKQLQQEKDQEINALKAQLAAYQKASQQPTVVSSYQQPVPTIIPEEPTPSVDYGNTPQIPTFIFPEQSSPTITPEEPTPSADDATQPTSLTPKPATINLANVPRTKPQPTEQSEEISQPHPSPTGQSPTTPNQEVQPVVTKSQLSILDNYDEISTADIGITTFAETKGKEPVNNVQSPNSSYLFISAFGLTNRFSDQTNYPSQTIVAPQAVTPLDPSISLANDLAAGLIVAQHKGQINYRTHNYRKVQTAIGSLRRGTSENLQEAAHLARISPSILVQVAKWGEVRPGRFDPYQVSLVK